MITNLKLKNWRSHFDTEMDFSDGTNALIGIMGSGKTSILDAICFALFGTFPGLNSKRVKIEELIMKKPKVQQEAEVSLTIQSGDDKYTITRKISKTRATSAELRKNDKLIESPQPQKVNDAIREFLKTDYDLFSRAIYSEQNQLDHFLSIPKGQRMKKIDDLLAIDKFENARLSSRTISSKLKIAASKKHLTLEHLNEAQTSRRVEETEIDIRTAKDSIKKVESELTTVKERRTSEDKKLSEIKANEKVYKGIEDRVEHNKALLNSYQEDIDKKKDALMEFSEKTNTELKELLDNKHTDQTKIKSDLEEERTRLNKLNELVTSKSERIKAYEGERIPNLKKLAEEEREINQTLKRKSVEKVHDKLNMKKLESDKTNADLQKFLGRIEEIEDGMREIETSGTSCPICDQKLSDIKKKNLLRKKNQQITRLKANCETSKRDSTKISKDIYKFQTEIKELEKISYRLEAIKNSDEELKRLETEKKELVMELNLHLTESKMQEKTIKLMEQETEEKRNELELVKSTLEKRTEIEEKLNLIKQMEIEMVKLRTEKSQIKRYAPSTVESLEAEVQKLFGYEKQMETKIEYLIKSISEKESQLEEMRKKVSVIRKLKQEAQELENYSNQFLLFETALKQTQEQLRTDFIESVNGAMESIWEDLYPYKDFSSARLEIEDGDYVLKLHDSTGWVAADGSVSGGERAMACLALRIGFSLVLAPQLRWLILDEPTHNLDAQAVSDLSNVLRDRIGEFAEQVFLITHDPTLEDSVTGYLYRLERDKEKDGFSQVTKVMEPETSI